MHRALKLRLRDRTTLGCVAAPPPASVVNVVQGTSERFTSVANAATAVSAVLAAAGFLFGVHQFNETLKAQRDSIFLQQRALESDRASKAADLYAKYLDVVYTKPETTNKSEARQFRLERDNRALVLLNAMYSVSKGDEDWQELIQWSLLRFEGLINDRQVICLDLTSDFKAMLVKRIQRPDSQMCIDISDGN